MFLFMFVNVFASATSEYIVPSASTRVCRSGGIAFSIPNEEGVLFFGFHANINQQIQNRASGQLNKEISQRNGNRWMVKFPNTTLEIGDEINYWFYVIVDGLGYSKEGQIRVTESMFDDRECSQVAPSATPQPGDNNFDLGNCQATLTNLTMTVSRLQNDFDSAKETSLILRDILSSNFGLSTTLTLSGPVAKNVDLTTVVQSVINDKLGLHIRIRNVVWKKNGTVRFQVATLDDKVTIIKAANEKLRNSNYTIMY